MARSPATSKTKHPMAKKARPSKRKAIQKTKTARPTKSAAARKAPKAKATKLGRPTKRTLELDAVVRRALQRGLSLNRAADLIGVSSETLRRWRATDDAFEATVKKAQATGVLIAAEHLWQLIETGNVAANIYWLKTRAEEFREIKHIDRIGDTEELAAELEAAAKAMRATVEGPGDGYA